MIGRTLAVVAVVVSAGCGESPGTSDGGDGSVVRDGDLVDRGSSLDAGVSDGGGPLGDGGPPPDGGPPCDPPAIPPLATEQISSTMFERPVFVTQAPGVSDTLWVAEQGAGTSTMATGRIRLARDGEILPTSFLEITVDRSSGERGLLGLAFHPNYEANGRFFVFYTAPGAEFRTIVAEYHRSAASPDVADPTEVQRLLDFPDAQPSHNGGMLAFGRDGYLYASVGDGGGACDRHRTFGNAQALDRPLGKIHRLDVDNVAGGFAAAANPFEAGGGLATIWAYGLRNPWRFSFDRATGDLYIGDVGQAMREEISFAPADSVGGENYGWRFYEGTRPNPCGDTDEAIMAITHTPPIFEIDRAAPSALLRTACAITGGYVYRGSAIPELDGVYFFGDYCSDDIGAFRYCDGAVQGAQRVADLEAIATGLVSLGQDNAGEIYLVYNTGRVHRIVSP